MSSEILRDGRLRDAQRARQRGLGQVVRVERGDVDVRRGGHRFLRLRDFDIAGHAGAQTDRAPAASSCVGELDRWSARPASCSSAACTSSSAARTSYSMRPLKSASSASRCFEERVRLDAPRLRAAAVEDRDVHGGAEASTCCARSSTVCPIAPKSASRLSDGRSAPLAALRVAPARPRDGSAPRGSRRVTRYARASAASSVIAGSGAYGILSVSTNACADRQPDRARQLQLQLLEIVLRRDERAGAGSAAAPARAARRCRPPRPLAFRSCACWNSASAVSCWARAVVTRLSAEMASRYRFTATSTTRSRALLMPVFLGLLVQARRVRVVHRADVEQRLRQKDPRVEDVERPDDRRLRLETRTPRG